MIFFNGKIIDNKILARYTGKLIFVGSVLRKKNKLFFDDKIKNYIFSNILKPENYIYINETTFCKLIQKNHSQNKNIIYDIFILPDKKEKIIIIPQSNKKISQKKLVVNNEMSWQRDGNCIFPKISSVLFWQNYFSQKGFDGYLCLNHKGRIIKAGLGDLLVIKKRIFYYTDIRNKFLSVNPILKFIIKNIEKAGLKKAVGKGNGLSLRLLSEADEVYVHTTSGIYPVEEIQWGKNIFKYNSKKFQQKLNKIFNSYGKKILCGLERT